MSLTHTLAPTVWQLCKNFLPLLKWLTTFSITVQYLPRSFYILSGLNEPRSSHIMCLLVSALGTKNTTPYPVFFPVSSTPPILSTLPFQSQILQFLYFPWCKHWIFRCVLHTTGYSKNISQRWNRWWGLGSLLQYYDNWPGVLSLKMFPNISVLPIYDG